MKLYPAICPLRLELTGYRISCDSWVSTENVLDDGTSQFRSQSCEWRPKPYSSPYNQSLSCITYSPILFQQHVYIAYTCKAHSFIILAVIFFFFSLKKIDLVCFLCYSFMIHSSLASAQHFSTHIEKHAKPPRFCNILL